MQDISTKPLHITMEQLDKMLTALGHVRQDVEGATVFRDDAHDALIVLPVLALDAVVSQAHLISNPCLVDWNIYRRGAEGGQGIIMNHLSAHGLQQVSGIEGVIG